MQLYTGSRPIHQQELSECRNKRPGRSNYIENAYSRPDSPRRPVVTRGERFEVAWL